MPAKSQTVNSAPFVFTLSFVYLLGVVANQRAAPVIQALSTGTSPSAFPIIISFSLFAPTLSLALSNIGNWSGCNLRHNVPSEFMLKPIPTQIPGILMEKALSDLHTMGF